MRAILKKNLPVSTLLIRLSPVKHKKLKVYSIMSGISIQKIIEEYIDHVIEKNSIDKKS